MRNLLFTFVVLSFITAQNILAQELIVPPSYSVLDSISGDLDHDSIKELVVAYHTKEAKKAYENVPRVLIIYKHTNHKWIEWKKSETVLYGSQEGGMMGDPFDRIEIINGILLISQNGGSSWKWGFTDKYCFQDGNFYLIGYSSLDGRLCEYWREIDFNLSTGKIIIKKEYEACETSQQEVFKKENEIFYRKGISITIEERHTKEVEIISPKYKHEIHI